MLIVNLSCYTVCCRLYHQIDVVSAVNCKFGTDVHWYGTDTFRYWATENLTSVSAILDFKMAAAANRKLAIFLDLSQLQT